MVLFFFYFKYVNFFHNDTVSAGAKFAFTQKRYIGHPVFAPVALCYFVNAPLKGLTASPPYNFSFFSFFRPNPP